MRRKSDMWQELDEHGGSFLPEVDVQENQSALANLGDRLDTVEQQLLSQYTSIAAYAQIAQQSVDTARAEARADLDREKTTLVSLVERVRDENACVQGEPKHRLATLEDRFDQLNELFAQCLRNQEELAHSIATLLEAQMRGSGWISASDSSVALSVH